MSELDEFPFELVKKPRSLRLRFPRLWGAWYCLRGKPVAFRLMIEYGGIALGPEVNGALVHGCTIRGANGYSVKAEGKHIAVTNVASIYSWDRRNDRE